MIHDLQAIADDAQVLDELGQDRIARPSVDPVIEALAAWREEVDARPLPPITEAFVDDCVAAVHMGHLELQMAERSYRKRRPPLLACAVLAIAGWAGLSGALQAAGPGDTLWPAAQVLQTDRAASVQAAYSVADNIDRAKRAIAAGQPGRAAAELLAASAQLPAVLPEDGVGSLGRVQAFLVAKVNEQPPGQPMDPGAPLRSDPTRPVPVGAQLGVAVPGVPVTPIVAVVPLSPAPAPTPVAPSPVIPAPTTVPPVPVEVEPTPGAGGSSASNTVSNTVTSTNPPPAPSSPETSQTTASGTSSTPTEQATAAPTSSPETSAPPSESVVAQPIEQPTSETTTAPPATAESTSATPTPETTSAAPVEPSPLAGAGEVIVESASALADEAADVEISEET